MLRGRRSARYRAESRVQQEGKSADPDKDKVTVFYRPTY